MMIRLKLYLLLFFIAVSIPLSFVIWRTYAGVAREEQAQLRYFAQTLFDDMEKELGELVRREENRAVDAYGAAQGHGVNGGDPSPLSRPAQEAYILGYLQNDPDGQMQTPLAAETVRPPERYQPIVDALQEVNRIFNRKKWALPGTPLPAAPALRAEQEAPVQTSS
ncbi:MAG: hypothetical protein HKP58_14235, partial [Desulfatitalea sp.]|nr:hypothetical protein [Desulfatitalea sp.]NNK01563.1 hypothetical protein [Desulfatitalea sp.]